MLLTIYDGPSTELSQMVNETHDTDPSPAFSIRRTLQSGGIALVILVGMLLGVQRSAAFLRLAPQIIPLLLSHLWLMH